MVALEVLSVRVDVVVGASIEVLCSFLLFVGSLPVAFSYRQSYNDVIVTYHTPLGSYCMTLQVDILYFYLNTRF